MPKRVRKQTPKLPEKYNLVLLPKARSDIEEIMAYTARIWGEGQAIKYKILLRGAMDSLCKNPQKGRFLPHKNKDRRCLRAGKHMIYYRVDKESVYILRVLHERMDADRHLDIE